MTRRRWVAFAMRRAIHAVPLVFGVLTLTFLLIHLAPGDPIVLLAGDGGDAAYYAQMRARYGLDRPLPEQYVRYVAAVLSGDFGYSYAYQQPVFDVVVDRLPATLLLSGTALVLATTAGTLAGVFAAVGRSAATDLAVRLITSALASAPVFWIGQMLLLAFAVAVPLFPVGGMTSLRDAGEGVRVLDVAWHLVLPSVSLALAFLAVSARVMRASLLAERRRPYLSAAAARGVPAGARLRRHALPNAVLPVVTITGYQTGMLLTGAGLTEALFAWPGLGRLLLDASLQRDYPLIIALLVTASFVVIVANIVTDVVYTVLDPRIDA